MESAPVLSKDLATARDYSANQAQAKEVKAALAPRAKLVSEQARLTQPSTLMQTQTQASEVNLDQALPLTATNLDQQLQVLDQHQRQAVSVSTLGTSTTKSSRRPVNRTSWNLIPSHLDQKTSSVLAELELGSNLAYLTFLP